MAADDLTSPRVTSQPAEKLRQVLLKNRELFSELDHNQLLLDRLRTLEAWQSQRLQDTHADLARHPRFGPGVDFFVNQLYAPQDFSARDADIEAAYPYMVRLLPDKVLATAALAMEFYVLSQELDRAMTRTLFDELKVQAIDQEAYAEAYRINDDYRERSQQLEMLWTLSKRLDDYVRHRFLFTTLKMARGPAMMIGLGDLQAFLEKGFAAFRHMRGSGGFVRTVTKRETGILDRIFARDPEPFRLRDDELTIEE